MKGRNDMAAKAGKKIETARKQIEPRSYSLQEAVPLLQKVKFAKFDETVDVAVKLGVDPRHAALFFFFFFRDK